MGHHARHDEGGVKRGRAGSATGLLGFSFDGVLAWGAGEGLHAGGTAKGDHAVVGFDPVDGSGSFVVDRADVVDGPSSDGCGGNGCAEEEGGEKWLHGVVWAGLLCASETETHDAGSS